MGAVQFTAVLIKGKFIRVSDLPEVRMKGTSRGYTTYEVTIPSRTITAKFFRSNRGNEYVYCGGERFGSFAAAQEWAAQWTGHAA